jgi:hypothetical protein
MSGPNFHYFPRSRYTAAQLEVLEAIEDALKHGAINFATAIKLRDRVKSGKVDMVLKTLEEKTGKPIKLADSIVVEEDRPN